MKSLLVFLDLPLFGINYLFLVMAANVLMPDDFSKLNGYLASLSIAFISGAALQSSSAQGDLCDRVGRLFTHTIVSAFCVLIISLFMQYRIFEFLILLGVSLMHPMTSFFRGYLIYVNKIKHYYINMYLESLTKVLLLALFMLCSVEGLLMICLTLIISQLFSLIHLIKKKSITINFKKSFKNLNKINTYFFKSQFIFFILIGLDFFLLEKYEVSGRGEMSLCIRFAQLPLMIIFTLLQFQISKIGKDPAYFFKAVTLSVILYMASYASLLIIFDDLMNLLFGEIFLNCLKWLHLFMVYYFFVTMLYVYVFIQSVRQSRVPIFPVTILCVGSYFNYFISSNSVKALVFNQVIIVIAAFGIFVLVRILANLSKKKSKYRKSKERDCV